MTSSEVLPWAAWTRTFPVRGTQCARPPRALWTNLRSPSVTAKIETALGAEQVKSKNTRALVFFLLWLGQSFVGLGISVFTQGVKLFARNVLRGAQSQLFCAHTNPLAGTNFTGGVVIVPGKMFVEVTFGIGQILMRYGSKHTGDVIWFPKRRGAYYARSSLRCLVN